MRLLEEALQKISAPNFEVMNKVQEKLAVLDLPQGGLGRLENMVQRYAGIMGQISPAVPKNCMVITSADHGVAKQGISAYPISFEEISCSYGS